MKKSIKLGYEIKTEKEMLEKLIFFKEEIKKNLSEDWIDLCFDEFYKKYIKED